MKSHTDTDARLLALSLVGAVIDEDTHAIDALAPLVAEHPATVIHTLVGVLVSTLTLNLGHDGAHEQLNNWRSSALCED
ncbi:hypothetical protein GCM10027047_33170 [Rhodococcus aerolatus]